MAWLFGLSFWGPQISPHKDAGSHNALQAGPEAKSHLGHAGPIFCDLYFFTASSLKV